MVQYPLCEIAAGKHEARQQVQFITMDMSGAYIPLAKRLFPNAKIVLDCFHIIQHLSRALKNHWRLFQKDSRKLSLNSFYSKTFRQTFSPHEVIEKTLDFSEELTDSFAFSLSGEKSR